MLVEGFNDLTILVLYGSIGACVVTSADGNLYRTVNREGQFAVHRAMLTTMICSFVEYDILWKTFCWIYNGRGVCSEINLEILERAGSRFQLLYLKIWVIDIGWIVFIDNF